MAERHSFERVDSLFAHLDAVERRLADNQQAFLRALDDKYSASGLGPLQEEAQELARVAATIVKEIEAHVADSSAHAVFTGRRRGDGDSTSGSSGVGARSAMEAVSRLYAQRAKDNEASGSGKVDVLL